MWLIKKGSSVHAQIYPPITKMFKPLIKEGSVYNLAFFQVKKANRMYKPVENDIMIHFTRWTTVEEVVEIPPAFPVCTYCLTPIEKMSLCANYKEYFTDVIGAISSISSVSPLRTRAQAETFKRTITIRDARDYSLDIALWGERATSFSDEQVHRDGQLSPQFVIFVGTLVKSYADNVYLSGGSSCKWYINPEVPEAQSLRDRLRKVHEPVILARQVAYSQPKASTTEHKKVSDIKYLHPFKNKKVEWLVTVKVMKVDKSWYYDSCKKCLKTAKPHGDKYKCTNSECGYIGASNPRYKLVIIAGDETGDTEFIVFGRMAQRLIKKSADTLIANNPRGFIPDEITRLLEKVFVFNVSFTENTITSGNVFFQVNALVAEIAGENTLPMTPAGSQSSSIMLSQGAGSSMQGTPTKGTVVTLPSPSAASESTHASSTTLCKPAQGDAKPPTTPQSSKIPDESKGNKKCVRGKVGTVVASPTLLGRSSLETQKSASKRRTRTSPSKRTAKKLFVDEDAGNDGRDWAKMMMTLDQER